MQTEIKKKNSHKFSTLEEILDLYIQECKRKKKARRTNKKKIALKHIKIQLLSTNDKEKSGKKPE